MSDFKYYTHQNAELIAMMAEHHKIKGDLFWMKLDRKNRTMTDEISGRSWEIPKGWDVT